VKVSIVHQLLITAGPSAGSLVAVGQVVDGQGNTTDVGAPLPLTAGEVISFGEVTLDVPYPGGFTSHAQADKPVVKPVVPPASTIPTPPRR
jgi:hypothetical protein